MFVRANLEDNDLNPDISSLHTSYAEPHSRAIFGVGSILKILTSLRPVVVAIQSFSESECGPSFISIVPSSFIHV